MGVAGKVLVEGIELVVATMAGKAAVAASGRVAHEILCSLGEAGQAVVSRVRRQTISGRITAEPSGDAVAKTNDAWQSLVFGKTPQTQQRLGEESRHQLHERLRTLAVSGFQEIRQPTQIETPSWYTFDASQLLGIEKAVAVATSTNKHDTPLLILVGIRKDHDWMSRLRWPSGEKVYRYKLHDLGRSLTAEEKNAIYDQM